MKIWLRPDGSRPDFHAALSAVTAGATADRRAQLAHDLAAALSSDELGAWVTGLKSLPASDARDGLLAAALERIAATMPGEAMNLALSVQSGGSRQRIAKAVAEVWAATNYRALFDYGAGQSEKTTRDNLQRIAVRRWCEDDPDAAFRALAERRFNDGGVMIWMAARAIAQRDPDAVFTALDLVKDPRVWDTAAGRVFEVLAGNDLPGTVDLFFQQTDPKVETPLAYALGAAFARDSAAAGIDVLNKIPDDTVANNFLHGMIHTLDRGDMAPLLANVDRIKDPVIRHNAAISIGRDLVRKDLAQTMAWLPTVADEETRSQAYQGTGMGYAKRDAQAAQAWLNALAPGKERRYAIFGFASEYAEKDPAVASAWAMTVVEPEVRERLVTIVLRRWAARDAASAQAWARQTGYARLLPSR